MLWHMEALLSIGEFSTLTGLSPKRLRSYASAGILVPAAVDASSGYRYYRPSQIHRANLIAELRRAGASVAEIGTFFEDPSEPQLERFE
jgi:DNA-binding transcriptional MerR regulator